MFPFKIMFFFLAILQSHFLEASIRILRRIFQYASFFNSQLDIQQLKETVVQPSGFKILRPNLVPGAGFKAISNMTWNTRRCSIFVLSWGPQRRSWLHTVGHNVETDSLLWPPAGHLNFCCGDSEGSGIITFCLIVTFKEPLHDSFSSSIPPY